MKVIDCSQNSIHFVYRLLKIVSNRQDSEPEGQAKAVQATSKHFLSLKRPYLYTMSYFRFEIDFSIASAVSGALWYFLGNFGQKPCKVGLVNFTIWYCVYIQKL